jgi:hypothetical protein
MTGFRLLSIHLTKAHLECRYLKRFVFICAGKAANGLEVLHSANLGEIMHDWVKFRWR